jgi:hypothetical protein
MSLARKRDQLVAIDGPPQQGLNENVFLAASSASTATTSDCWTDRSAFRNAQFDSDVRRGDVISLGRIERVPGRTAGSVAARNAGSLFSSLGCNGQPPLIENRCVPDI